jgi:hypothetical protein
MFCPRCRSEYRPGFTHCNDCDVDLVWGLPREEEHGEPQLVKVFETGNATLAPVVESILRGADIECVIRNPREFNRLGANPMLGAIHFLVRDDEADAARELLADLSRYDGAQGRE